MLSQHYAQSDHMDVDYMYVIHWVIYQMFEGKILLGLIFTRGLHIYKCTMYLQCTNPGQGNLGLSGLLPMFSIMVYYDIYALTWFTFFLILWLVVLSVKSRH